MDDNKDVKTCGKYHVVGTSDDAMKYLGGVFIVGIGKAEIRKRIQEKLIADGFHVVTLIHPKAVVAPDVFLGEGSV